jgi:hypothetical protein
MLKVLTSASSRLPHQPHAIPLHSLISSLLKIVTSTRVLNNNFILSFFKRFANFSRLQASECVFLPASETFCDVKSQQENFSLW